MIEKPDEHDDPQEEKEGVLENSKSLYNPVTFAELDQLDAAREAAEQVRELTNRFMRLTDNIMYDDEIADKGTAVISLAGDFASRVNMIAKEVTPGPWYMDDLKAQWSASYKNALPDSSFLYIESGGKKDDEGKTTPRSLRHLPYKDANGKIDLPHLRNAISRLSQQDTGATGGESWLTASRRTSLLKKARSLLKQEQKGLFAKLKGIVQPDDQAENSFTLWKEATGYRWLAIYSNNYRDDDNPAEIISAAAHKDFVKAVDNKQWPYPELWLWHVKGTKWGVASFLAYDEDTGFSIASGTIDPGYEHIAERLTKENTLVSHGMPGYTIHRDPQEPTIITQYRTREISPLPAYAAANKGTGFGHILQKETKDMLPEHKRKWLEELGIDVSALEADLEQRKGELDAAGVESKEKEEDVPAKEEAPAGEPQPDATEILRSVIAEAIGPLVERVTALETGISAISADVGGVKSAQQKQAQEMLSLTPSLSLTDLIKSSVIGKPETFVDGRTKEASDGPAETPAPAPHGAIGIPVVDLLKSGHDWREAFKSR